jgi:hypothetical protein
MELKPSQREPSLLHQDMNTLIQPLLVQDQLPQQPHRVQATQLHMDLNHTTPPLTTQAELQDLPMTLLATMVIPPLMNMLPTLMERPHLWLPELTLFQETQSKSSPELTQVEERHHTHMSQAVISHHQALTPQMEYTTLLTMNQLLLEMELKPSQLFQAQLQVDQALPPIPLMDQIQFQANLHHPTALLAHQDPSPITIPPTTQEKDHHPPSQPTNQVDYQ